jgi:hypothetical protein
MPLWDGLGRALASQMGDYPYTTPLDAISAYTYQFSRPKLVEQLAELLSIDGARPGPAHLGFCKLPFDIVCTTNFDFLLERSYSLVPRYCRPIVMEDQLSVSSEKETVTLLKLHGDLHHPERMVVTEEDYDGFLDKYPIVATYLANLLISRTPLFIGYSLEDQDFRQLWQIIGNRLGRLRRTAYALSVDSSSTAIDRFQRRGVKVINLPKGKSYGHVLELAFQELQEYWSEELPRISTLTQEQPLGDLSMPKDAVTRLCYFSVPVSRPEIYSFYRSQVFPIAQAYGFNPITAEDMISPGENILANVSTIVDRAEIIVVDAGGLDEVGVRRGLEGALLGRTPRRRNLLLVIEGKRPITFDLSMLFEGRAGIKTILRPKDVHINPEAFLDEVGNWFREVSSSLLKSLTEEPRRLLDKSEYRAAVISAITVLEAVLFERLFESKQKPKGVRTAYPARSLIAMLRSAVELGYLNPRELDTAMEWNSIRNRAVHSNAAVPASQAKAIVSGVDEIANRLRTLL